MFYEVFQYILDNYINEFNKVDSNSNIYNALIRQLPAKLREYINRDDLIVKGSMGQGNKSDYPWVAILNKKVTRTTQKGIYLVYLFKKDMSGFYLSLNQGITHFEKVFKRKKYDYAVKVSKYFKSQISDLIFVDDNVVLGDSKHDLGYGYSKTSVIAKHYPINNFNDEILENDLKQLISIYDLIVKHMETSDYDEIIRNVLVEESDVLIDADTAIEKIKEVIDLENDMPFGFERELKEVVPYQDKDNRFRRITQPKYYKTDYIKKAVKEARNGLFGEKLALSYEKEKLINLGRDDLAAKVKHVAIESDAFGYDIESYEIDENGKEIPIKIEVKTSSSKVDSDFYISKNEIEKSKQYKRKYCLFRIYDCNSSEPKFYKAFGEVEENFIIDPITFIARYKYDVA